MNDDFAAADLFSWRRTYHDISELLSTAGALSLGCCRHAGLRAQKAVKRKIAVETITHSLPRSPLL